MPACAWNECQEETIKMDDEDDRNNSSDGGHHPKKTDTTVVHYLSWPYGKYSIPKPQAGCPLGWSEGWRYQDNEDNHNINSVTLSTGYHFYGTFNKNTRMYYCTKTTSSGSGSWPSGNYCIARKGGSCPSGFSCTGYIYWDDEDNANANSHWAYFQMESDGSAYSYMNLPTSKPFYLYQYTSTCQRVRGMTVRQESVKMDDEDDRNNSSDFGCHPKKLTQPKCTTVIIRSSSILDNLQTVTLHQSLISLKF
ncbi:unnamed protein product [Mytilus edulis]|uniref:Apextrin C-terminal domain-containing protein n=1 Tax=Mytilus edulis TaxID=6550 RepID=A0A8S3S9H3_MYTED|nr:unnamed protein product [Mytilus edulis]